MIDLETSKNLADQVEEFIDDVFGDGEKHEYILIVPTKGAMISNIDDGYRICASLNGVAFSILSGTFERRLHNKETGQEVKSN